MDLNSYLYLPRTGRYANPWNSNDRMPVVFGEVGIVYVSTVEAELAREPRWTLPAIAVSTGYVAGAVLGTDFCYSIGRAELSAVDSFIYINGVRVASSKYSVVDGHGAGDDLHMTYIHFNSSADMPNLSAGDVVTAQGRGINYTTVSGSTIINNIGDCIEYVLTQLGTYTTSILDNVSFLELKKKWLAVANPNGAITEDETYWGIIQSMMASYNGFAFINGEGKLSVYSDNGIAPTNVSAVFPRKEITLIRARQIESNLINSLQVSYDYSRVDKEFKRHVQLSSVYDQRSINIFGTQEPATPYQLHWNKSKPSTVVGPIIQKYSFPWYEVEIEDQTLKRAHLDLVTLWRRHSGSFTRRTETNSQTGYLKSLRLALNTRRAKLISECRN